MQRPNSLKIKVRISAGGWGGVRGGSRVLQGDGMSGYTRASAGAGGQGGQGGLKVTKGMKIRALHDSWTTELILLRVIS